MVDTDTRRALYHRLHWLWPILASPLFRRTLRVALWGGLAVWLVFAALVLALRYIVLPNVDMYHGQIERALASAIGQPVTIGKIEARWQGLNPDLVLDNVAVADRQGVQVFSLEQVETVLSWHSLWRGQVTLASLVLERPVLHVRRETSGRITVAGIDTESEGDSGFSEWVLAQKRIRVRNATIVWDDRLRAAPPLALEDLQFGLDNRGRRHRFGLSAAPPAELAARIDVRGEISGDLDEALEHLAGRIFVQLDYADLAGWRSWIDYPVDLAQGRGALRIWGDLADGQGKLTTDLALEEVRIRLAKKLPELDLASLRGRLEGRYKAGAWALAGRKVELRAADGMHIVPTDFQAEWQLDAQSGKVTGSASASIIDLATIGKLAAYLPLDTRSRDLLERHRPQGRIAELRSSWTRDGDTLERYSLRAAFTDLGLLAGGYFPGAHGLAGQVEFTEKGGSLSLGAGRSGLSLPAVFPEPDIAFDQLRARANWKVAGDVVDVKLESLQFDGADAAGAASGTYHFTGDGPGVIDLAATISHADGRAAWRYMPHVVDAEARDWLRTGIVAGRAHDGKLVLKGDLADFPFADGSKGKFLVTAKVAGGKLDYAPGWPVIEQIDADMSFGVGMRIVATKGEILGARLAKVTVEMPEFDVVDRQLVVRGEASGPTGEFLRFIEQSPVGDKIDNFTQGMQATGNGKLDLAIDMPLRRRQDTKVRGEYRFENNQLQLLAGLPPLTQVNGRLALTETSVSATEISGRAFGGPLKVAIRSLPDRVAVQAGGTANVAELAQHFGLPVSDRLSGNAAWKSNINVRKRNADFVVESDLLGITSRLPEPLAKSAASPLALRVERTATDARNEQFRVTLGNVAQGVFIKRDEAFERAVLAVGDGEARLPERGVAVRVAVPRFDADAWKDALAGTGSGSRGSTNVPALDVVSLKTPVLRLFGRDYTQVDCQVRPRDDGWQIAFNTQEAAGDLFWRNAGEGWVEGRLRRLVVRPAAETAGTDTTLINSLPGMNLAVDDFHVGEKALGQLELKARNDKGAWHLDTLSLKNPDGTLDGKAQWLNTAGRNQTRLDFELKTGNVGKLLERLGYVDAVRRGTATLTGDLHWDGPLTGIHYPSLTGHLAVNAENGQFNKLEPGVGRLLGLISLQSLPRRLTLDFRDIFSEGLAFDSIDGKMVVAAGVMRTVEPLRINSPAAQIEIQGDTDLKKETQNLQVVVRPQVGNVAAIGAATLVNPIVGAAALVASTILQNPLGRLFSYRYQVTGGWSDPKVEKTGESVEHPPPTAVEGVRQ